MVAAGTPDMQGGREQGVWFRYQQIECSGAQMKHVKLMERSRKELQDS